jgi:hypothetical protein
LRNSAVDANEFFSNRAGLPLGALRRSNHSESLYPAGIAPFFSSITKPFRENVFAGSALRQPFPGNVIPPSRLDPVGSKMVQFYPAPVNNAITGNLPLNPSIPNRNNTFDLRLDQYAGAHHFFGRGTYQQPEIGQANYFQNIGNPTQSAGSSSAAGRLRFKMSTRSAPA